MDVTPSTSSSNSGQVIPTSALKSNNPINIEQLPSKPIDVVTNSINNHSPTLLTPTADNIQHDSSGNTKMLHPLENQQPTSSTESDTTNEENQNLIKTSSSVIATNNISESCCSNNVNSKNDNGQNSDSTTVATTLNSCDKSLPSSTQQLATSSSIKVNFDSTLVSDINNKFNANEKCDSSALVSDSDLQIDNNKNDNELNVLPKVIQMTENRNQSLSTIVTAATSDSSSSDNANNSNNNSSNSNGANNKNDRIYDSANNVDTNQDKLNNLWNKSVINSNLSLINNRTIMNINKADEISTTKANVSTISAIPSVVAATTTAATTKIIPSSSSTVVEPSICKEKIVCDTVITDNSNETNLCNNQDKINDANRNVERCYNISDNDGCSSKSDISGEEKRNKTIINETNHNLVKLKCDTNVRLVNDVKLCSNNQNNGPNWYKNVEHSTTTNTDANVPTVIHPPPPPLSSSASSADNYFNNKNAIYLNKTQQRPINDEQERYASDAYERIHNNKSMSPYGMPSIHTTKTDRRQSLEHYSQYAQRYHPTDDSLNNSQRNPFNRTTIDSSNTTLPPSTAAASRSHSLYISNPDFTKHKAARDLSPLRMKPPDFSKVSDAHYSSSPDLRNTTENETAAASSSKRIAHPVNPSNFAEISKKYNYISDLQLKNPSVDGNDGNGSKSSGLNHLYVKPPDFSKFPQNRTSHGPSMLRQQKPLKNNFQQQSLSSSSSIDEPTAHVIQKNQYIHQQPVVSGGGGVGETSNIYKSFPQISHDVTMSIVSPDHHNQYASGSGTSSTKHSAAVKSSIPTKSAQISLPIDNHRQSFRESTSEMYKQAPSSTSTSKYSGRVPDPYMSHHIKENERIAEKCAKIYERPPPTAEIPSANPLHSQYQYPHHQYHQHSKYPTATSGGGDSDRSESHEHHMNQLNNSMKHHTTSTTRNTDARQQHHHLQPPTSSISHHQKSVPYEVATKSTEHVRQTYQSSSYNYAQPLNALHHHDQSKAQSSRLMQQHNQLLMTHNSAAHSNSQITTQQPTKPLSSHTKLMDTGGGGGGQMHPPQHWPMMTPQQHQQQRAIASPISLSSSPINTPQSSRISQSPIGASPSPHQITMPPSPSYMYTPSPHATPSPSQQHHQPYSVPSPVHFKQSPSPYYPPTPPQMPPSSMASSNHNQMSSSYYQAEYPGTNQSNRQYSGHYPTTRMEASKTDPSSLSTSSNRDAAPAFYPPIKSRSANKMPPADYVDLTKTPKPHEIYQHPSSMIPISSSTDRYHHSTKNIVATTSAVTAANDRDKGQEHLLNKTDGRYTQSKTIMDPYAFRQASETDLNYEIIKKTLNKDISVRRSDADLSRSIFDSPKINNTPSVAKTSAPPSASYTNDSSFHQRTNYDNYRNEYLTANYPSYTQSAANLHSHADAKYPQRIANETMKPNEREINESRLQQPYKHSSKIMNPYETSQRAQSSRPNHHHHYDINQQPSQPSRPSTTNELSRHDLSVTVSQVTKSTERLAQRNDNPMSQSNSISSPRDYNNAQSVKAPQPTSVPQIKIKTEPISTTPSESMASSAISSTTKTFGVGNKRESPLDLSVKTVKNIADSTGCDDYNLSSSSRRHKVYDAQQTLKVDFAPNFQKHTNSLPRHSVSSQRRQRAAETAAPPFGNHQQSSMSSIFTSKSESLPRQVDHNQLNFRNNDLNVYQQQSGTVYEKRPDNRTVLATSNRAVIPAPPTILSESHSLTSKKSNASDHHHMIAKHHPHEEYNERKYQEPQKPGLIFNPPVPTVFGRKPEELKNLPPINYPHENTYPPTANSSSVARKSYDQSIQQQIDRSKDYPPTAPSIDKSQRRLPQPTQSSVTDARERERSLSYGLHAEPIKNHQLPSSRYDYPSMPQNPAAWPNHRDKQYHGNAPQQSSEQYFNNPYYTNSYPKPSAENESNNMQPAENPMLQSNKRRLPFSHPSADHYNVSKKPRLETYSTASHTYYPPIGHPGELQKYPPPPQQQQQHIIEHNPVAKKNIGEEKYDNRVNYIPQSVVKHSFDERPSNYYPQHSKDSMQMQSTKKPSIVHNSTSESYYPQSQPAADENRKMYQNYQQPRTQPAQPTHKPYFNHQETNENSFVQSSQHTDRNTWYPPTGIPNELQNSHHADASTKFLHEYNHRSMPPSASQYQQNIVESQSPPSTNQETMLKDASGLRGSQTLFDSQTSRSSNSTTILKGADQNVISKLRINLEQKEIEKQKLIKSTSVVDIPAATAPVLAAAAPDDDTGKSDIASLIAARIRTKGELKGFTPIPPISTTEPCQSSSVIMKVELQEKDDQKPVVLLPQQQDIIHTTTTYSDVENNSSASAFDLMDWGSACNDFVEQLQNGATMKKRGGGRRKCRTKSSANLSDAMLDSLVDIKPSLDKLPPPPFIDYKCADIKDDNITVSVVKKEISSKSKDDDEKSSSDEDKPLLLLRQQSLTDGCPSAIKMQKNKFDTDAEISDKSSDNSKKKQLREKREQEKLQSLTSSSSDSDNDNDDDGTGKYTAKRSKKVPRKLRSRASIEVRAMTSEDTSDTNDVKAKEQFFPVNKEKRKKPDSLSSDDTDTFRCEKKVQKLNEIEVEIKEKIVENDDPLAIAATPKRKTEEKSDRLSSCDNIESDQNVVKTNAKKSSPPSLFSPSKVDPTMTRSKRKRELENSIILRNDKHIKNAHLSRSSNETTKRTSPKSNEKISKSAAAIIKPSKIDEVKRKILDSDSDDGTQPPATKKRTNRVAKLQSSSSSSSASASSSEPEKSDTEQILPMVAERLRSKKLKIDTNEVATSTETSVSSANSKLPEKFQEKKWSQRTPKKGVHTPQKASMKAEQFPPGWEEQVYEFKRSLKIPASLITVGKPPPHRKSVSLPDLDPHSSDASETCIDNRRKQIVPIVQQPQPAKRGRPSKLLQIKAASTNSIKLPAAAAITPDNKIELKSKSIIDLLHQRVIRPVKNCKKMKLINTGPKILPQSNEVELLPTPGAEGTDVFKRHHNVFETAVLKSRTRKEYRVQKNQEIIREVFGGEVRPASAPPDQMFTNVLLAKIKSESDIKQEPVTFDQKYKQYLEKMNIDFCGEKIRKVQTKADELTPSATTVVIKIEPNDSIKPDEDSLMLMNQDDETQDTEINECDRNSEDIKEEALDINNERDTPSVMSERDGMTPNTLKLFRTKKGRGNRAGRRKGSSGFDYIRKKKKPIPPAINANGVPIITKRREAAVNFLEEKDENDINREIRGWVLNKGVGESVLHKAARLGYIDVIAFCLERLEIAADQKDNAGYTPLHEACSRGRMDIARLLLMYGANHSETAHSGIRPLHEATENGYIEIVRLLLSYGADPLLATYAGQTPIMLAENDEQMVSLFKNYIFDIQNTGPNKMPWRFEGPWKIYDPDENGFNVFDTNELQCVDDTIKSYASTSASSIECPKQLATIAPFIKCKLLSNSAILDDEKCDSNSNIMYPQRPESTIVSADNIAPAAVPMQSPVNKKLPTTQQQPTNTSNTIATKYKNLSTCTVVLNSIDPIRKIPPGRKTAGPKSVIAALAAKIMPTNANNEFDTIVPETTTTPSNPSDIENSKLSIDENDVKENVECNQGDSDDDNGELFEFEEADVPHVPLYHLRDEGAVKWALLNDLCYLLKVKSKDTLLKQICSPSSPTLANNKELLRELKMSDFLEKATCLQLLCAGEKLNIRASKVILVKYNDSVKNLLGVKTVLMRF